MSKKIRISKKNLLKMVLFVAVVATAVLFDLSHKNKDIPKNTTHNTQGSQSHELSQFCFYNSFNTFKLKLFSDKDSVRKLYLRTQTAFIQKYHNQKAGQLAKSELSKKRFTNDSQLILIRFHKFIYRYPDDGIPVA